MSRLQCHVIAGLGADPHYTEYTDRDTEVNYKPFIWGNTVILYLTYAALTSQITRVIPAPGARHPPSCEAQIFQHHENIIK